MVYSAVIFATLAVVVSAAPYPGFEHHGHSELAHEFIEVNIPVACDFVLYHINHKFCLIHTKNNFAIINYVDRLNLLMETNKILFKH